LCKVPSIHWYERKTLIFYSIPNSVQELIDDELDPLVGEAENRRINPPTDSQQLIDGN